MNIITEYAVFERNRNPLYTDLVSSAGMLVLQSDQIIERYYVTHLFLLDCSMAESLELAESEIELKTVLANVCERLGYSTLRPEQAEAVSAFAGGKDVFVALPTGSGKSLCFAILPCTQPCWISASSSTARTPSLFWIARERLSFTLIVSSAHSLHNDMTTRDRVINQYS